MSAEAKHTRGPLFVEPGADGLAICKQRGEDVFALAHMDTNNDVDDAKANAVLFASAPDLLEACKVILDCYTGMRTVVISRSQIAMLRDAVAKAEGKE